MENKREQMMTNTKGCLFLVSTPIGNNRDITLRAKDVLSEVDAVICEEYRQGSTLLKKLGFQEKELILLNEHNEKENSLIIADDLSQGRRYALISDCGTPAFADPGTELINICYRKAIPVIPIPGPSSLITAISISPVPMEEFYFAGFLPKDKQSRNQKLSSLKKINVPIVLMDAPYRLNRLLTEVSETFGKSHMCTLAFDLTLPTEMILYGPILEIAKKMIDKKGEFILILYA